jgi:hypothetical protein
MLQLSAVLYRAEEKSGRARRSACQLTDLRCQRSAELGLKDYCRQAKALDEAATFDAPI